MRSLAPSRTKALWLALCLAGLAGCRQDMSEPPYYRPLQPSAFFPDERSARPLVAGTVARGHLEADEAFYTGKKPGKKIDAAKAAAIVGAPNVAELAVLAVNAEASDYADVLPFEAKDMGRMLQRGQERFNIFCAVCHDRAGTGKGMIVLRGFTRPPAYATDDSRGFALKGTKIPLRDVPVGYLFEVISEGFGAMPRYGERIPAEDRWAIVSYIRALQLSQHATLDDVQKAREREELLRNKGQKR